MKAKKVEVLCELERFNIILSKLSRKDDIHSKKSLLTEKNFMRQYKERDFVVI